MIKTFIYLVLLCSIVVSIVCQRMQRDYIYESESEDQDSISVDTSTSVEESYDELVPLPIGNLNSRKRNKGSYMTNWQYTPPQPPVQAAGDTKEKILIEVTPKPPSSYRVRQKPKPYSGRHTTRRTTTTALPFPANFQPQWSQDKAHYDKLIKSPPAFTSTSTRSKNNSSRPDDSFQYGHSNYEYDQNTKNSTYRPRPGKESQDQLTKLFGSPPTFDWGTIKPTYTTTRRPNRRPGYFTSPIPTVSIVSTEKAAVKIKWKPKYTTVPFDDPNNSSYYSYSNTTSTFTQAPIKIPTTTRLTTTPRPKTITTVTTISPTQTYSYTSEIPKLFSLFNVTNLIGGAAGVNSIVNGINNVSGTVDNPISWVTSSVEQTHYDYDDYDPNLPPLSSGDLNINNSTENLEMVEVNGNPIRNTEPMVPGQGTGSERPPLPSRIRNTIDDLKQQLVVFVEDLWDRTLYGGGGGNVPGMPGGMPGMPGMPGQRPGGGKGGFGGGKGGGKGGKGKGGGGGGGNTWVGPYRSVLFQFNRFELNVFNGTVDTGVIPEPVKQRISGSHERIISRPYGRKPFTRKAQPSIFPISDY